jgi:hypothetical protein
MAPRAGRVRQRAEEVEDRPDGELLAHRDDEPRGLMVARGEHEAEAELVDARADVLRAQIDPHAERLEHVGRARAAGRGAVAVLGHRAPRAGGDQGGGGRDVEGRPPAARAGGVDELVAGGRDVRRERAHRAREAGDLLDGLALRAQGDQQARDLRLGRVAGHDDLEHLGRLVDAEMPARGDLVDRRGEHWVRHWDGRGPPLGRAD